MIEEKLERIAAALETIATLLIAQTPQNPVIKAETEQPDPAAPKPRKSRKTAVVDTQEAPTAAVAPVAQHATASDEIQLEGDDAEDDFLKDSKAEPVAKKLEIADVRAELVKIQTNVAGGGNARVVLGFLKKNFGADTLAGLKPEQFQAVIDAAKKLPEYPKS